MAHRIMLTERKKKTLFGLPSDEQLILQHYTLNDEDLHHIRKKRKPENRLGFALQLCAFRYPGRLLQRGEIIPQPMLSFIAAQLGTPEDVLLKYGEQRLVTRYEHSASLQGI